MEVLIRWPCQCNQSNERCDFCSGKGYFEQWIPIELVRYFKSATILDRRFSHRSFTVTAVESGTRPQWRVLGWKSHVEYVVLAVCPTERMANDICDVLSGKNPEQAGTDCGSSV